MADFKIGDVVRLKSNGSPLMVVTDISGDNVLCTWLNASKKKEQEPFPSATLEIVKNDETITTV